MVKAVAKSFEKWSEKVAKKTHDISFPNDFMKFNEMIGFPIHPNSEERTPLFDFQLDYFNAVTEHHKVILNKSRKIGATETALRIIAYNCFDKYDKKGKKEKGRYVGHHVMIVAGNKQSVANGFIKRFRSLFKEGFTDNNGITWTQEDIMTMQPSNKIELYNGTTIEAYPASEAVRGEANVKCIFMSESAFIKLNDDSVVYKAVRPNISNIEDADFILESTPNGRRGFYYDIWMKAQESMNENKRPEFWPLEQPYTVGLHKILSEKDIEDAKMEGEDFFLQEFCCFDDKTELLTDKGFKLFDDLKNDDLIASLNKDTLDIEYVKPIGYLKQKSDEILELKNKWFDCAVTSNHNMLVLKGGGHYKDKKYKKRLGFKRADKLSKSDVFYRSSKWVGYEPDMIMGMNPELFCKLMGYYLSEGNTVDKIYNSRHTSRVSISQTKYKDIMYNDLKSLGFIKQKKCITTSDKKLVKYLNQFGYSYQKYVPNEIKKLSPRLIRIFLDAFRLGDGSYRLQKIKNEKFKGKKFVRQSFYYTTSKKLRDDLCELILKVGKTPSITSISKKGRSWNIRGKSGFTNHDLYTIHEGNRVKSSMRTIKVTRKKYDGFVYCVELPKNNTLYVRRNGKCAWSGNCKFTTSGNQAFKEDEIIYKEDDNMDYFDDI